jgi:hypothetical protein
VVVVASEVPLQARGAGRTAVVGVAESAAVVQVVEVVEVVRARRQRRC